MSRIVRLALLAGVRPRFCAARPALGRNHAGGGEQGAERPRAHPADGLEQLEQVRLQRQRADGSRHRRRDGRSGMRDAGYQYVVIDDCWHGPARRERLHHRRPAALPVRDQGARRLRPFAGAEVRHLFGRGAADLRRAAGQPGPRISGRADLRALGRRLSEIRLVQHRRPQCPGSLCG